MKRLCQRCKEDAVHERIIDGEVIRLCGEHATEEWMEIM